MSHLDDDATAVDAAVPARRARIARETPELIAIVLLVGSTIGVLASVGSALLYGFSGDRIASGDGTGSYSRADLGQTLLIAGRFADVVAIAVVIAVAALWWHVGVLTDRLDELDDVDDDADLPDDAGDAEFLAARAALAREASALRWARALTVACALGALAGVIGQFLQYWQEGFGSSVSFFSLELSVAGIAVVTLALALAGWIAARSLLADVRSALDLGPEEE